MKVETTLRITDLSVVLVEMKKGQDGDWCEKMGKPAWEWMGDGELETWKLPVTSAEVSDFPP